MRNFLRDFNVFVQGVGFAGRAKSFTPPEITINEIEHRAGGLDAPIGVDMGMERPESTIVFGGFEPDVLKRIRSDEDTTIKVKAALTSDGDPTVKSLVVEMTARIPSQNLGEWTPEEFADHTLVIRPHFYSITLDGTELLYVDVKNQIRRVDGVDQLEAVRAATGR